MENLLDLTNQDETQPVEATESIVAIETVETEATTQPPVGEEWSYPVFVDR
jgi:hypothetical protein